MTQKRKIVHSATKKSKNFRNDKNYISTIPDIKNEMAMILPSSIVEPSERGRIHDIIKSMVYYFGNALDYSSQQIIDLIGTFAKLTFNFTSASNLFFQFESILNGVKWVGKIGFDALFSMHPNIIGPVMSVALSGIMGYTLGSFIGRSMWPSFELSNSLYSTLTLQTNVSLAGLSTAAITVPIGGYYLTQRFGDLADVLFLETPDSSILPYVLRKCAWAMIGVTVLMFSINGLHPGSVMSIYTALSGALSQIPNPGIFSTLNIIMNLKQMKDMIVAKDYRGLTVKSSIMLIINLISNQLTGNSLTDDGIDKLAAQGLAELPIDTAIHGGVVKELMQNYFVSNGTSTIIENDSKNITCAILGATSSIPLPDVTLWSSISDYLGTLVVTYIPIFGNSSIGILASWLCASIFVIWAVWSIWKRRSLKNKLLELKTQVNVAAYPERREEKEIKYEFQPELKQFLQENRNYITSPLANIRFEYKPEEKHVEKIKFNSSVLKYKPQLAIEPNYHPEHYVVKHHNKPTQEKIQETLSNDDINNEQDIENILNCVSQYINSMSLIFETVEGMILGKLTKQEILPLLSDFSFRDNLKCQDMINILGAQKLELIKNIDNVIISDILELNRKATIIVVNIVNTIIDEVKRNELINSIQNLNILVDTRLRNIKIIEEANLQDLTNIGIEHLKDDEEEYFYDDAYMDSVGNEQQQNISNSSARYSLNDRMKKPSISDRMK